MQSNRRLPNRGRSKDGGANRGKRPRGRLVLIGVALCVLCAAAALGWALTRSTPGTPTLSASVAKPSVPTSTGSAPASGAAGTVEMPDVVGLRRAEALIVLSTAEVRAAAVGASSSPDADSSVISQQPAAGELVETGTVARLTYGAPMSSETSKPAARRRKWVVCIDAGHQAHGDSSPEPIGPNSKSVKPRATGGATGVVTEIPEYEIALQIATNLRRQLVARDIKVVMVRTTNDVNLGNAERAAKANRAKADLFVRIHADGSPEPQVSGVSTLYPASNKWTRRITVRSKRAARCVQDALVASTGAVDRGIVRRSDIAGFNWSKVPVILVETGFLSNSVEDRLLASPHYQDKVAVGIADGVVTYLAGTR